MKNEKGLAQVKRELAEIDKLLAAEGIVVDCKFDVPVEEGVELAKVLDSKLRPFLVRYVSLLNKGKQYVPITADKLADYVQVAEKLSRTNDIILSWIGVAYGHAIKAILNGADNDVEDLVQELFTYLKISDIKGFYSFYVKSEGGTLNGINVVKDEDAE